MLPHKPGPWEQKADWPSLKEAHLGSAQITEEVTMVVRSHACGGVTLQCREFPALKRQPQVAGAHYMHTLEVTLDCLNSCHLGL